MEKILIKNMTEFYRIADKQVSGVLSTIDEIKDFIKDIEDYSIFSLVDGEEQDYYIYQGMRYVNNIGYYVLKGNYFFKDDCLDE